MRPGIGPIERINAEWPISKAKLTAQGGKARGDRAQQIDYFLPWYCMATVYSLENEMVSGSKKETVRRLGPATSVSRMVTAR